MRFVGLMLSAVLAGGALAHAPVAHAVACNPGGGGAGTSEDPFLISTPAHLAVLATNADCRTAGLYFKQTTELTLTGPWTPIGTTGAPFQGTYVGNGEFIRNLSITTAGADYLGLFGYVNGAEITGVHLANAIVSATSSSYVGGLAGYAENSTIQDSSVTGSINGTNQVGGLVGSAIHHSRILNSSSAATVSGGEDVGGLIGIFRSDTGSSSGIWDSSATGSITGTSTNVGGLVGELKAEPDPGPAILEVARVFATGSVNSGTADSVGGLIGRLNFNNYGHLTFRLSDARAEGAVRGRERTGGLIGHGLMAGDDDITLERSHATGRVIGASQVGGFIGDLGQGVTVTESSASGEVTSTGDQTGGFAGYMQGVSVSDSYASGDVTSGGNMTGGFVGSLQGASAGLTRVYANGNVTGDGGVGGLVGSVEPSGGDSRGGVLQETYATGDVTGGAGWGTGGLVGTLNGTVERSFATGRVQGVNLIGGLVGDTGLFGRSLSGGTILDSYALGRVEATLDTMDSRIVGGLIGSSTFTNSIIRSYSTTPITAAGDSPQIGGVTGYIGHSATFSASSTYWDPSITNATTASGMDGGSLIPGASSLTTQAMRSSSNFVGWDFNTVWGYQCGVSTTPVLRWANPLATSTSAGPCPTPDPGPTPAAPSEPAITPVAPTQPPVIDQLVPQEPGASSMTIGGQVVPVARETGARGRGATLSAGPVTMTVRSTTPNGRNVPLAADGSLILARSGEVPIEASGLAPGSVVTQTLFSDPIDLGSTVVDASGDFRDAPKIPANTPLGSHTLSVRGTTNTGEPFTLNIGVTVATPAVALGADPILTVKPARPADVPVVNVTARGVQARCMVTFTSGKTSVRTRSTTQGTARATLTPVKARSGRVFVTMRVSGKGCSPITVRTQAQTSRN